MRRGEDLVISNARIIVGNGQVIEKGAMVVKDGRIVSVSEGAARSVSKRQAHRRQGHDGDGGLY